MMPVQHDGETIRIKLSKTKLAALCALGVALALGALWLASGRAEMTRDLPFDVGIVAYIAIPFFSLTAMLAARKLLDQAPGLIVDDLGLIDNASGLASGRVLWRDITGFKVWTVGRQRFIAINVYDPQFYIDRAGLLKRYMSALNAQLYGSPIQISSVTLQIRFDELLSLLTAAHTRHRAAQLNT